MLERFLFRVWSDGCVVFDRQSGDTHALDPIAGRMFLAGFVGVTTENQILRSHRDDELGDFPKKDKEARARLTELGLPCGQLP